MPPTDAPMAPTRTVRFTDVMSSLRRGAPLAIGVAIVASVIAFLVTERMDPVYEATAGLLASQPPSTFGNVDLIRPPAVDPRVYQRVLLDSTLMHDALLRLDGVDRNEDAMKAFQRRVRVSVENQDISSVIHIQVRDSDSKKAAADANAIAEALIDWDRNRAREMVANSIAAIERSITDLDDEIAAAVAAGDAAGAQRLQTQGATLREQRVRELESARARSASAVVVGLLESLSVAQPPGQPIGPRLVFNVFVALVLGIVFGYSAQFARWAVISGVVSRQQLANLTNLPVLAVFPRPSRGSHRLSPDAVSFFRANLLRIVRKSRPVVFGITSPDSYSDKTGVAVSLADGLARGGLRTLVIDADLRRQGPGLGLDLGRTQTPSLDVYLQDPDQSLQPVTVFSDARNSFDVLPSRAPARQASELIAYGFEPLLVKLRATYDAIIVDLPPVLSYADALAAAPSCTGIVVAVSVGSNGKRVVEAVELLETNEIELLGTVLTGAGSAKGAQSVAPGGRGRSGISLDFELGWGVRDTLGVSGAYRDNLLGAREAIPRILDLLVEYEVAATWATVGFLFAESRDELFHFAPGRRPKYVNERLNPFPEVLGSGEAEDPLHFAPSLIREIGSRPRQEMASHTFSHYYCLEAGQTVEDFGADIASAVKIAAARGHSLTSIVFPRNQLRVDYLPTLVRHGFTAFRGNEANALNRPRPGLSGSPLVRVLRAADIFIDLTGSGNVPWAEVVPVEGLVNVRSSRFLRPWQASRRLEALRWQRVASSMTTAAKTGSLFHLWWHPHNFGVNLDENLAGLKRHLERFARLRGEYGFASHTMAEVAAAVLAKQG